MIILLLIFFAIIDTAIIKRDGGDYWIDYMGEDGPFVMIVMAIMGICILLSTIFSNSILELKHKWLKKKGIKSEGHIINASCNYDEGYARCSLEIKVCDVPFEIKGVAENEAFNYIYSYKHLLRYVHIPITVYLFDTKIYADLSSVNVNKIDELVYTSQNRI